MPQPNWSQLNPTQRDWVVQQSGYNPAEYQLGDDGYITSKAAQSPAVVSLMGNTDLTTKPSPTPGPAQQFSSDSPFKTAAKSFGEAAPSAVGAGVGTAGGLALASWLLGPQVGIPASLAFAFGGGLAGGAIARGAQNIVEPKSWQENVALSQAQNPIAGKVGTIASIPLGGFNPSPSTLLRTGGAIPKVLTGLERTGIETAALRNVGIGATMGGAGTVAQNVIDTGQLPSIPQFLEGAATGAVFNQPNVIGRKLGFHPAPTIDPVQLALIQAARMRPPAGVGQPNVNPAVDVAAAMGAPVVEQPSGPIRQVINKPAMARYKGDLFPAEEELTRMTAEGGPVPFEKEPILMPERTLEYPPVRIPRTEAEGPTRMFQEQPEVPQGNLQEWNKILTEHYGKLRGAKISEDGTLVNEHGDPIAGEALLRNKLREAFVKINPAQAGWDTLPHELFHIFFNDLRTSAKPADNRLVTQFEQKIGQSPEFQKWAADRVSKGLNASPEEFITKDQGTAFVRRQLMMDKGDTGIKQTYRDIVAHLKTKYTKTATLADYRRLLNYKFTYAKPYGETFGRAGVPANIPSDLRREQGVRQQEKPVMPQHESVKMLLDRAVEGTDKAEIKPEDADEIHNILLKQVDWTSAPDVYKKLNKPGFDTLDPEDWMDVKKYYDLHISKPVPPVEMREPTVAPVAEAVKPTPVVQEPVVTKPAVEATPATPKKQPFQTPPESVDDYISNVTRDFVSEVIQGKKDPKEFYLDRIKTFDQMRQSALKSGDKAKYAVIDDTLRRLLKDAGRHMQDQPEIPKLNKLEQDIEEYRRLDEQRNKMIADGSYLLPDKSNYTPEFKSLWQQIEDVKNRHEGLPPVSKRQQEIPELRGKPGEGQTPYPFTMKELTKGNEIIHDTFKTSQDKFHDLFNRLALDLHKKIGGERFNQFESLHYLQNPNQLIHVLGEFDAQRYLDEFRSIASSKETGHATGLQDLEVPEILRRNQESPEIKAFTDSPERKQSFAPILTSRIDKIAEKLQSPIADYVTDKLHKFSGEQDYLAGQIGNKLISATKGFDKKQIENVYHYLHEVDDKGSSKIPLSAEEKTLSDNIISTLREPRELQNKLGLKVKAGKAYRAGGIKPEGYMFNMLDPQVAYTWAEKPASLEARQYDKAYIDHQVAHGVSADEARQILNDYKSALGDYRTMDPEFQALRKAEGHGLPWDLVDKNFATASVRYGNRAARDLAFFKWIQSDPNMLHALQLKDQFGDRPDMSKVTLKEEPINASKEVQDAMRSVFGIDQPRNITAMAAARAVSNVIMGIGTAVRNVANMPAFIANYVQLKQLPLVAKAIQQLNESRTRAFQNNSVKASFQDFDAAGIYQGSPNPLIKLFNRFSELGRKYQGRDLSNRFEGEFYNSLGELLATDNIARAKMGDAEAIHWVKKFGDIVEGGPEKLLSEEGQVTQEDVSRFAKRFVDAARGTYGPEGLPSWAIEGEFAPFAALSRFSIEKANTIWKDVILPAKKGMYGPLIRYALGSLGSGLLIEKLNELLTGKRGQEPKINEILASGNYDALIPKAISLLQLASFAGTVGDTAQLISHGVQGKSMTTAQPLSFPLYSFVTDTLGKNIFDASRAIKDGEDPFDTLAQLVTSIGTQGIQSYRYLDANVINPEQAARKERFRDYSIYQELLDQKQPDASINKQNPFEDQKLKQFKRTGDIQEAAGLLPDLLKTAFEKAKGNPERLKKELQKIKANSYQTMPSPDRIPLSFRSYLMYLEQTQGRDAATERLKDYLTQNAVNKAKGSMVPSF